MFSRYGKPKPKKPTNQGLESLIDLMDEQLGSFELDNSLKENYSSPDLDRKFAQFLELGQKFRKLKKFAGKKATQEFISKNLLELSLMGATTEEMAACFNVTPRTVYNWRSTMRGNNSKELTELNVNDYIYERIALYRLLKTDLMVEYRSINTEGRRKAHIRKELCRIDNQLDKFLGHAGFYERVQYKDLESCLENPPMF